MSKSIRDASVESTPPHASATEERTTPATAESNADAQARLACASDPPPPHPPLSPEQAELKRRIAAQIFDRLADTPAGETVAVSRIVADADPFVRASLATDPVFLADPAWGNAPVDTKQIVLMQLGSLFALQRDIFRAREKGSACVPVVQVWANAFPSLCDAAITSANPSVVSTIAGLFPWEADEAIAMLLFRGAPPPVRERLETALGSGDIQRVLREWDAAKANTALLAELSGNAEFLGIVDAAGPAIAAKIRADMGVPPDSGIGSPTMLALVQSRVGPLNSTLSGLVAVDASVVEQLTAIRREVEAEAQASSRDPLDAYRRTADGMTLLRSAYDASFGSLVADLTAAVDDAALLRRALTLVEARASGVGADVEAVATCADPGNVEGAIAETKAMHEEVVEITDGFSAAIAYNDAAGVEWRADQTAALPVRYPALVRDAGMTLESATSSVEVEFRRFGGSLRRGIEHALTHNLPALSRCFSTLGWGSPDGMIVSDGAALDVPARDLFGMIERASGDRSRRAVREVLIRAGAYWHSEAVGTTAPAAYERVCGISLPGHLAMIVSNDEERTAAADALGVSVSEFGIPTAGRPVDDLEFDPTGCSFDFNLFVAAEKARTLHDSSDLPKHQLALAGRPEEQRVILEVFERTYGVPYEFWLHRQSGFEGEAATTLAVLDSHGDLDLGQRILAAVEHSGGTTDAVQLALAAKPEDAAAAAGDDDFLDRLHARAGADAYQRIYAALTGELSLADALRPAESGELDPFGLGWGTSEGEMNETAKAYFAGLKARLADPAQAATDSVFREQCRAAFLDRDVRALMNAELSGKELAELDQILATGDTMTPIDTLRLSVAQRDSDIGSINDAVRKLSDSDRATLAEDPSFLASVAAHPGSSSTMALLRKGPAEYDFAQLFDLGLIDAIDEDQLARVVLRATPDQIEAYIYDRRFPLLVARLPDWARPPFEELVSTVRGQECQGEAPAPTTESCATDTGGDLASGPVPGDQTCAQPTAAEALEDATVDERARTRTIARAKHTLAIGYWARAQRGPDLYAAVQAVFREQGWYTPDLQQPTVRFATFGDRERRQVWDDVRADFAVGNYRPGNEIYDACEGALVGGTDPSARRLAFEQGYWYDKQGMMDAITNVSDAFLAAEWSNVQRPGANGMCLGDLWREYEPLRDAWDATTERDDDLQAAYELALHRFRDFPLDVSATLASQIKNEGWFLNETTARDFLEIEGVVRARIVALPAATVAAVLGIPATDPSVRMLTGTDRAVRSEVAHDRDMTEHLLGQGSIIDPFTNTDEALALAGARVEGELGTALVAEGTEAVGSIDDEEAADIRKAMAEKDVAEADVRAARKVGADVLKWAGILAVSGIATALTGPGGPTLLAILAQAGATAMVQVIAQEAALGNDFDTTTEGFKQIAVETAMAGLTVGIPKIAGAFGGGAGANVQSALEWWNGGSAAMKARYVQEYGAVVDIFWAPTEAAMRGGLGSVKSAAFAFVDPDTVHYGFVEGAQKSETSVREALYALPQQTWDTFRVELAKSLAGAGVKQMRGEYDPKTAHLDGASDVLPEQEEQDFLTWLATDTKRGVVDKTVAAGATEIGSGRVFDAASYDEDKFKAGVGAFLADVGKSRVASAVGEGAKRGRTSLNARDLELRDAQIDAEFSADPDLSEAMKKSYKSQLASRKPGDGDLAVDAFLAKMAPSTEKIQKVAAEIPSAGERRMYVVWATANPGQMAARADVPYAEFRTQFTTAKATRMQVELSPEYGALSPEQRAYYDVYMDDPTRLMEDGWLDIRKPQDLRDFDASMLKTKKAFAVSILDPMTKDWMPDERRAVMLAVETRPTSLPPLTIEKGSDGNAVAMKRWAETIVPLPTDKNL